MRKKPNNRKTKPYRCRAKHTKNIFKNNEKEPMDRRKEIQSSNGANI